MYRPSPACRSLSIPTPCLSIVITRGHAARASIARAIRVVPATTMCEVVADLDDAMLEDLAAYYFELPFVSAQQEFDAGLAAAGQAVHDKLCEKCHSDAGMNPDDEAGILGGQWMGYMKNTFCRIRIR